MPQLFEFKARSNRNDELEKKIQNLNSRFVGEDFQTDTYFHTSNGRLKLREGKIENALIHYHRQNIAGAKASEVLLYKHQPDKSLKAVLTEALGVKIIVEKKRRIWFVDNVKIHFDTVPALGEFVEVEAIGEDENMGLEMLKQQCDEFAKLFEIGQNDYVAISYSDMLLEKV